MGSTKIKTPSSLRLLTLHAYDVLKYVNAESQKYDNSELKDLITHTLTNLDQINFELTHLTINENAASAKEACGLDLDKKTTH